MYAKWGKTGAKSRQNIGKYLKIVGNLGLFLIGVEENQRLKIKGQKYKAKIKNVNTGSQIVGPR